ncbi:MAG TPA: alpha/beta fold hydrolase [Allosphingosinicella sp.]|nr:alpha/beta fold hydrolase [Allosphingosinicella sp.]
MNAILHHFAAADGTDLAWHELRPEAGNARPVLLLHGLFSNAFTNWLRYGHAAAIAAKGFRVIMPDLRAHGESGKPHDPACYPPDILADDGLALIARLGLDDYDLGGYSLGARTSVRMVARGAAPGRLIVAGMGLQGLLATGERAGHFRQILTGLGTHERGSPEWLAEAFLKTTKGDPLALLPLLDTFVDTPEAEIAAIAMPTLVLSGEEDADNGSPRALAALLPRGEYAAVPGGHMSAVIRPELGRAMADFLAR